VDRGEPTRRGQRGREKRNGEGGGKPTRGLLGEGTVNGAKRKTLVAQKGIKGKRKKR